MSSLSRTGGQRSASTCSLRFSPEPTPRKKRPSIITAAVALAWAITAGCVRIVGQVTPVPRRRRSVACATAPITDHTNELSPWRSIHGWKWSEISAYENPTSSARAALRTSCIGPCSSLDSAYPSSGMGRSYPGSSARHGVGQREEDRGGEDQQDPCGHERARLHDVARGPDHEAEPEQHEEEPGRDLKVPGLAGTVARAEEIGQEGDEGGEHGGESILRVG